MCTAPATLAVIGGGSTATSFLYQFVEAWSNASAASTRLHIKIFDPCERIGPGQAYQADNSSNLLNTPARSMSALASDRGDFINWLRSRDTDYLLAYDVHDVDPADFYPRPLFGEYLAQVHGRALARAEKCNIEIEHIRASAESISPTTPSPDAPLVIQTSDGSHHIAGRAVLCNGNLPSATFPDLLNCEGYLNTPYPVSELCSSVGKNDDIVVLGTSLSAIDAVVALSEAGHTGHITALSRNGRLPAVKNLHNAPIDLTELCGASLSALLASPGSARLSDIAEVLLKGLERAGSHFDAADVFGKRDSTALAMLDDELHRARSGPRPWQAVGAATNAFIEHLWHALREDERHRFLREWKSTWMARQATFPIKNAEKIRNRLVTGQLSVLDGYISATASAPHRFEVVYGKRDGTRERLKCGWIVNATGISTSIPESNDPLLIDLQRRGIATADPFGGVRLDFETGALIDSDERIDKRFSLLGSLATGTYFWTNSMEINARLAFRQANRIASELAGIASFLSLSDRG